MYRKIFLFCALCPSKKETAPNCIFCCSFLFADRLRWSVYRVLLQVAHLVIRFLGAFLSSYQGNHASNLPVPSLYLHSPLCLHFRLLALLRRPSFWRNAAKNSVPRFGILRQYHAGYHVIHTLPRHNFDGNQAYITSVSIMFLLKKTFFSWIMFCRMAATDPLNFLDKLDFFHMHCKHFFPTFIC